jgi:hypothetical protein
VGGVHLNFTPGLAGVEVKVVKLQLGVLVAVIPLVRVEPAPLV